MARKDILRDIHEIQAMSSRLEEKRKEVAVTFLREVMENLIDEIPSMLGVDPVALPDKSRVKSHLYTGIVYEKIPDDDIERDEDGDPVEEYYKYNYSNSKHFQISIPITKPLYYFMNGDEKDSRCKELSFDYRYLYYRLCLKGYGEMPPEYWSSNWMGPYKTRTYTREKFEEIIRNPHALAFCQGVDTFGKEVPGNPCPGYEGDFAKGREAVIEWSKSKEQKKYREFEDYVDYKNRKNHLALCLAFNQGKESKVIFMATLNKHDHPFPHSYGSGWDTKFELDADDDTRSLAKKALARLAALPQQEEKKKSQARMRM